SLIERNETFVAYIYRGYWIDIGTPEKYMQVHRDIMDGLYVAHKAAPFVTSPGAAWVSPEARIEAQAVVDGPCFIDHGPVVKAGRAASGPRSSPICRRSGSRSAATCGCRRLRSRRRSSTARRRRAPRSSTTA